MNSIINNNREPGEPSFQDEYEPGSSIVVEEDEVIVPVFTPKTSFEPMPHQKVALQFMKRREQDNDISGGILALEMGLGKTFTSLYHIAREKSNLPTLIVVPKTVIYTWYTEIKKFFGNSMSVFIFRKENPKLKDITVDDIKLYNVVLTNYEYVRGIATKLNLYEKVAMQDMHGTTFGCNIPRRPVLKSKKGENILFSIHWNRIISDESHNFSNYKTSLWKTMMCFCATYRWCLTGTPIRNYGNDLYAQYKFLGYYEPQFDLKKFFELNLKEYIHHVNYEKANIKLTESKYVKVPCKLEKEQAEIYNLFLTEAKSEYKNFTIGGATFASIFTLFLRLRQICVAPYTITPESDSQFKKGKRKIDIKDYEKAQKEIDKMTGGLSTWVRDEKGTAGLNSSKIVETTKIIKSIPKGEKVIVFTMFKRVIDLLVDKFTNNEGLTKKFISIDGTVTGTVRDRAIDSFKNSDIDVLFISYKIGAEGLNIAEANHVILMENWWSPAIIDQAKSRVHRLGQNKPVTIYELYVPSTPEVASIEEAILEICENKRKVAKEYFCEGKSEKGGKMDANTLGKILNSRRGIAPVKEERKGLHYN
jgi:SNF2 family DNA or RNA helicase